MMKKLAILLAVIMMLALCACTNDPATTTEPPPTPSAPPSEIPSETPSTEPSPEPDTPDKPSPEPNTLPTEISRVVTLGGEDITDRVIELWNYANALYCDPNVDETAVRGGVLTTDYVEYAPMVDFTETVNGYLTSTAREQLFGAQEIPTGYPLFVEWYDGEIYRLYDGDLPEAPGRLVDITVLLNAEDTILLSMKYLGRDYVESAGAVPTDADCECAGFEILNRGGNWVVNDYEFSGGDWDGGDAVGYDGGYWHWGEVSEKLEVLTADGEDIIDRVRLLWKVAALGGADVEGLGVKSKWQEDVIIENSPGYYEVENFELVLDTYYTDAGREQLLATELGGGGVQHFIVQDGKYYRVSEYKSNMGVSGLFGVYTKEVTDDRMTLMIEFELGHFNDELCTERVFKDFTIAKVDGVWKIDDYEYIDY